MTKEISFIAAAKQRIFKRQAQRAYAVGAMIGAAIWYFIN